MKWPWFSFEVDYHFLTFRKFRTSYWPKIQFLVFILYILPTFFYAYQRYDKQQLTSRMRYPMQILSNPPASRHKSSNNKKKSLSHNPIDIHDGNIIINPIKQISYSLTPNWKAGWLDDAWTSFGRVDEAVLLAASCGRQNIFGWVCI